MRNKKLITLLVCLAMSVASVGALSSCGEMFDEQSSSSESVNGESSIGSTEKETYTVSFDGANGSEVATETVEEGETLEEPTAPTKAYYTFDGWYNGETKWNFETDKVTANVTLTAKWTAKVYTVKFVGIDGATVVEEKTYTCENVDSFVEPTVPNAPEHFTDGHWDKAPEQYLIYSEEPIVVTAVYVRPEYTVKFVNGETEVSSSKVGEGLLLEEPIEPTKDYYTFDGWYNGETKWNFAEDTVSGEMTLTAKWTAKVYTVKFVSVDGATVVEEKTYTCENVDSFVAPAVPDAPEHFTDGHWDKAPEAYLIYSEEPIVVTATYVRIQHTVTVMNGETEVSSSKVGEGLLLEEPTAPTKDYYTFDGWYNGETKWNFAEDTVLGEMTLTAKFNAIEYKVQFVDFDGNTTELTYTAENVDDFALPTVPAAPEHYENARWNKAVKECTVYSETVIIVEAIADVEVYEVTFVNGEAETQNVPYNQTATAVTAELDGYIFNGWYLDGVAYDFNTPVEKDITLVASWCAVLETSEKSEISATYIHDNSKVDVNTTAIDDVKANGGASWYFDSDYVTDWNGTADRQLNEGLTFGVNGSLAGEHYITLPKLNYALYTKVDFAFFMEDSGGLGTITLNGVDVTPKGVQGNTNRLFSIITDDTGTYAVLREVNSANADIARIELPASVINGSEGLTFDCNLTGYVRIFISEFHVTKYTLDYKAEMASIIAQLPENANDLTGSEAEVAAVNAYCKAEAYMTEYEAANHVRPAVIVAAKDVALCQAVINATDAGEQITAIEAYQQYSNSLSAEDKASEWHQANVAAINAIIDEKYVEKAHVSILENDPTVDASNGASDSGERIQTGWGYHHTAYNTAYETYVHMIQFSSGNFDGIVSPPKFNYNASVETYFGLFAITQGNGTITIGGQSFSFDSSKEHYFKVMIKDGVLTMTDDSQDGRDGGATIFTVTLSADVLNGTAGLAIDFQFDAWSQAEITEMHATMIPDTTPKAYLENLNNPTVAGAHDAGSNHDGATGCHTTYKTTYETFHMAQFNADPHDGTITLEKCNYAALKEAYFGLFAITAGNGTITIGGQSFSFDASKEHYFKVMIKDGILTMTDDSQDGRDGGAAIFTVTLSADVLNGTAGLVIEFQFDAWSQVEITEMHALKLFSKVN